MFLSDTHASLFISNILVILAEARLKSAVTEPLALCECTASMTVTDIASPPATGVWYDLDATVAAVLAILRLQGGDVDTTRIRGDHPRCRPAHRRLPSTVSTVIDGPPPAADYQYALEQLTVQRYQRDMPAA